jgi:hypothetical protein
VSEKQPLVLTPDRSNQLCFQIQFLPHFNRKYPIDTDPHSILQPAAPEVFDPHQCKMCWAKTLSCSAALRYHLADSV